MVTKLTTNFDKEAYDHWVHEYVAIYNFIFLITKSITVLQFISVTVSFIFACNGHSFPMQVSKNYIVKHNNI